MRPQIVVARPWALVTLLFSSPCSEKCARFTLSFVDNVNVKVVSTRSWGLLFHSLFLSFIIKSILLVKCTNLCNVTEQTVRFQLFIILLVMRENNRSIVLIVFLVIPKWSFRLKFYWVVVITFFYVLLCMVYGLWRSQALVIHLLHDAFLFLFLTILCRFTIFDFRC